MPRLTKPNVSPSTRDENLRMGVLHMGVSDILLQPNRALKRVDTTAVLKNFSTTQPASISMGTGDAFIGDEATNQGHGLVSTLGQAVLNPTQTLRVRVRFFDTKNELNDMIDHQVPITFRLTVYFVQAGAQYTMHQTSRYSYDSKDWPIEEQILKTGFVPFPALVLRGSPAYIANGALPVPQIQAATVNKRTSKWLTTALTAYFAGVVVWYVIFGLVGFRWRPAFWQRAVSWLDSADAVSNGIHRMDGSKNA